MKIDNSIIKSLIHEYWSYIVITVLCFFLFKSCNGGAELKLANNNLKLEVKELVSTSNKHLAKNNILNFKILELEKQKQIQKTKIVDIQNKAKSDLKKVVTLNTKQIAKYYQERYKLPIKITEYGVVLSDTLSKKNITELVQKDYCFAEVKLFKVQLQLEEKKGLYKDTIIDNFTKSNLDLNQAISTQEKIITNTENLFKKEKNKKTFWKVASGILAAGAGYLLITK